MSLATEPGFRMRPGTLVNQTLLEPALETKKELDRLRDDLRRIELYNGTLVSGDGRSTVILVGVPSAVDRSQFYGKVLASDHRKRNGDERSRGDGRAGGRIAFWHPDSRRPRRSRQHSGRRHTNGPDWKMPASRHELRVFVARHIGLVPLAAVVMMLVLLFCFRNVLAALVPLPGVAGNDAAGLRFDGLVRSPDLSHHRRDAGAPHRDLGHQRHLSVQPLLQFAARKARREPRDAGRRNLLQTGAPRDRHVAGRGRRLFVLRLFPAGPRAPKPQNPKTPKPQICMFIKQY